MSTQCTPTPLEFHAFGRPLNKETNRPQPARSIDSIELVSDAG